MARPRLRIVDANVMALKTTPLGKPRRTPLTSAVSDTEELKILHSDVIKRKTRRITQWPYVVASLGLRREMTQP